MPEPLILPRTAAALAVAVALAACGDSGDRVTPPPPSQPGATTTTPRPPEQPETQSCAAPERGYRLEFPKPWRTNDAGVAEPCRFFHPEPFTLAPQTEATGIAINVRLNPVRFGEVAPKPEGASGSEVLDLRITTIDGRPTVRAETRTTGQGLLRPGTRVTGWFVDAGDGTLVATTSEAAAAGGYENNVKVLDAMMQSLRLSDRKSTCSTGRSAPVPTRHPELPEAVYATQKAIVEAARACDYDKLAELALAGDSQFTYSFGGGDRPATFWREAETAGLAPLRMLVELLDGPAAPREAGGTTQYLWPAAYAFESWQEVPPSARDDLSRIYGEEDLRRFEQFGSYVGHRAGITGSGDWIFFVGGD